MCWCLEEASGGTAVKPKLLDLFCGAGGCSEGYRRVGFDPYGVDNDPEPLRHYPFPYICMDALETMDRLLRGEGLTFSNGETLYLADFAAFHASPPCQGYSIMLNLPWLKGKIYPKLIPAVRELFVATAKPYIIENVSGARYSRSLPEGLQAGFLCGQMFGLPIFRHRYFETSFFWFEPGHPNHRGHIREGRKIGGRAREIVVRRTGQIYGFDRPECAVSHANMAGIVARKALGTEWMNRDEASQAIPPVYTEYIGKYLLQAVKRG